MLQGCCMLGQHLLCLHNRLLYYTASSNTETAIGLSCMLS